MKHIHNNDIPNTEIASQTEASDSDAAISATRRAFILKYGALAAITPVALTLTMQSGKALASSCTECGP